MPGPNNLPWAHRRRSSYEKLLFLLKRVDPMCASGRHRPTPAKPRTPLDAVSRPPARNPCAGRFALPEPGSGPHPRGPRRARISPWVHKASLRPPMASIRRSRNPPYGPRRRRPRPPLINTIYSGFEKRRLAARAGTTPSRRPGFAPGGAGARRIGGSGGRNRRNAGPVSGRHCAPCAASLSGPPWPAHPGPRCPRRFPGPPPSWTASPCRGRRCRSA